MRMGRGLMLHCAKDGSAIGGLGGEAAATVAAHET
jgi:hypothetical protein